MSKSTTSRAKAKSRAKASSASAKAKSSKNTSAKVTKTVTEPVEVVPENLPKTKILPNLQRWNVWLAVIFVVQAVAILLLSNPHDVVVTTNYLTANPLANGNVLVAATRRLFDLNIAYLVTLFLLVTAVGHVVVATVYRKRYEAELSRGINHIRWIDAAIVPSLMFLVIALLGGVYDASSLLMIMVLVAVSHSLASFIESRNTSKVTTDWTTSRILCVAGVMPIVALIIYAVATSVYGTAHLPAYVYWIYGSMAVILAGFVANYRLLRAGRGRWADHLFGERVYMIISLVAKTALAWQIFAGLLHP